MSVNATWQLEDFVDSLVVELDKTRETLAVKAINKPLSYTVKEVALDLNTFPSYDGDRVSFVTAQPGQEGASKVSIQLNSITDQQVRATTKVPEAGATPIEETDLDKATRTKLRRLGVSSVDDLKNIERKNVDLRQVSDNDDRLHEARKPDPQVAARRDSAARRERQPHARHRRRAVPGAARSAPGRRPVVSPCRRRQPQARRGALGQRGRAPDLTRRGRLEDDNEVVLTFDPFAVVKVNVRA